MNILIVGDTEDLTAAYVGWRARQRGWQAIELREDQMGEQWSLCFDDLEPWRGHIETEQGRIEAAAIGGAYLRLDPKPGLPTNIKLPSDERAAFVIERRSALQFWLNTAPFPVANRPLAGRSNGSKPLQMRCLSEAGFEVPKWIVTNEFHTLLRFDESCRDGAIYKACSGLRSQVREVSNALRLRMAKGTTPVVAQQYIPGRDVRIHVVNGHAYATTVKGTAIDYRFEPENSEFVVDQAPLPLIEQCRQMAASEGLMIAGFDFRVTSAGRWYCLEANPVPTFLPYEIATKQPIADALLDAFADRRKAFAPPPATWDAVA